MPSFNIETLRKVSAKDPKSFHAQLMRAPSFRAVGDMGEVSKEDYDRISTENKRVRGLGDIVAKVAQPAAQLIDLAFGTNVKNCMPCNKRQEDWNQNFPNPL